MIVKINHTTKGLLRFENVGKFETQNNSLVIIQPENRYVKSTYDKEKVASYSIKDMNKYD